MFSYVEIRKSFADKPDAMEITPHGIRDKRAKEIQPSQLSVQVLPDHQNSVSTISG